MATLASDLTISALPTRVGQSIPLDTPHAVSVSLPTWEACVAYEKGEDWVVTSMRNAYPRFFVDFKIRNFEKTLLHDRGKPGEAAMLFPSLRAAERCKAFVIKQSVAIKPLSEETYELRSKEDIHILHLVLLKDDDSEAATESNVSLMTAVFLPSELYHVAKAFWQHTGEGVSSRRADFCAILYKDGILKIKQDQLSGGVESEQSWINKGPRRYRKTKLTDESSLPTLPRGGSSPRKISNFGDPDYLPYIEERFGRNLSLQQSRSAKVAIRRRITGSLVDDLDLPAALVASQPATSVRGIQDLSEDDVYLYPGGINAIFNTHQALLQGRGRRKCIMFGFPYTDTLKILEKWGPGCVFYGHGNAHDLDDLEDRCRNGEKFLALFCEMPGNPLLKSPDLHRIHALGRKFDFPIVVDETIGNFMNVNVLPYADIVVSSLTKVFSGDSNVMGGCALLNPLSLYYRTLKSVYETEYEDTYWAEDAIFMERNSRDFISRIDRINHNAEAICEVLRQSQHVKEVFYPKFCDSRDYYDAVRRSNGGYGGLFSITFPSTATAIAFYDNIEVAKGPSLGTNFTLCSPYTLLAHYNELDWAARYGAQADLIRFSVGLEGTNELVARFKRALSTLDNTPPP
ncbi:hypothetical protein MMC25_004695 [Agyrium rufum]|nr:hypothetical protein [Agyrium rufum]